LNRFAIADVAYASHSRHIETKAAGLDWYPSGDIYNLPSTVGHYNEVDGVLSMVALLQKFVDYFRHEEQRLDATPCRTADVDYSALTPEEIEYVDPPCEQLFKNSKIVSVKGEL